MAGLMNLVQAAAKFSQLSRDLNHVEELIIAKACKMVADEAKRVIGTYDYGWPSLSASTLRKKLHDTPLLETGAMRDSIGYTVRGKEGHVGSNSDIAVYQELGTKTIPPRSFLVGAAMQQGKDIQKMALRAVRAVMRGGGLHSHEMSEFLHVLHIIKDTVKDVAKDANDFLESGNR